MRRPHLAHRTGTGFLVAFSLAVYSLSGSSSAMAQAPEAPHEGACEIWHSDMEPGAVRVEWLWDPEERSGPARLLTRRFESRLDVMDGHTQAVRARSNEMRVNLSFSDGEFIQTVLLVIRHQARAEIHAVRLLAGGGGPALLDDTAPMAEGVCVLR